MNNPYISIVIATYNAADFLERALDSIIRQNRNDIEIIIQDAESTDETSHILASYKHAIAHGSSEKDNGIYDAWNKALLHVRGEWVLFLGADDFLVNEDVISRCMAYLPELPSNIVYAYGAMHFVDDEKVLFTVNRSIHALFTIMTSEMPLMFSATFIRTSFVRPIGFNTQYRISSDLELVDKTLTPDNVFRLPILISCMRWGGMCTKAENTELIMHERIDIITRCVLPRAYDIVTYCIKTITDTDTTLLA